MVMVTTFCGNDGNDVIMVVVKSVIDILQSVKFSIIDVVMTCVFSSSVACDSDGVACYYSLVFIIRNGNQLIPQWWREEEEACWRRIIMTFYLLTPKWYYSMVMTTGEGDITINACRVIPTGDD